MAGFAPYNFIPFSLKNVPVPYAKKEELPKFNRADEGYTGRIDYEIRNLTGISVGGKSKKQGKLTVGEFCTDGHGNFVIPGSTVRGFFRSHAEILSASYPEYIEDYHYLFRKFADNCTKVRDEYSAKLKASCDGKNRIPDGVKAGYLYMEKVNGKKVYHMIPAKPFGEQKTTFFQVHERDLRLAHALPEKCYMYKVLIDKYRGNGSTASLNEYKAKIRRVKKNPKQGDVPYEPYRDVAVTFDYTTRVCNIGKGSLKGMLLNSAWMDGKTHHYIVSAEKGNTSFEVPNEDIIAYQNDYKRNCVQNQTIKRQSEFYDIPEKEGVRHAKLFFYKRDEKKGGKLVGFGPTPYFRIFYDNTVHDGIPCAKPEQGYDYVQSMFGYANASDAYKSRLNFSNCIIADKTVTAKQVDIYAGSPRGTAFQLYLNQSGRNVKDLYTYNNQSMKLSGYKFYWKRSRTVKGCTERGDANTQIAVVPENNVFKGSIHFENLKKEELGLLLYAIQVSDTAKETYQIGNAKQFGYGKIAIENVKVYQYEPQQRFTSLNVEEKDISSQVTEFKECYYSNLKQKYGIDLKTEESMKLYAQLAQLENADAYLASHTQPYMTLDEYKTRETLPTPKDVMTKEWKAAPMKAWIPKKSGTRKY